MMTWLEDACSLTDALRAGETTPTEQVEASLAAIAASDINAFSHTDATRAMETAASADPNAAFGGVPFGIKELSDVEGWPATHASLVFADEIADHSSTSVVRALGEGLVPVGLTTASEFGGLNVSVTKLNGVTRNPWDQTRTAGGSSGGSAAAVAAGLVPIASGGDGGGSIRIPAGFCGLLGMKGTAGRIPRGPHTEIAPLTVVSGCLARSVRDAARYYDVCAGYDSRDPYSLESNGTWEADLGSHDLAGAKIAIAPTLGAAVVRDEVAAAVTDAAEHVASEMSMSIVDVDVSLPGLGYEWALSNLAQLWRDLRDRWPDCRDDLTPEIAFGVEVALDAVNLDMIATVEAQRTAANESMAAVFDEVDFIFCATNPDIAFPADVGLNTRVGNQKVGPENNGALTIPANIVGNPAVSIPVGTVEGLPVGMQVIGRHHRDAHLFDIALAMERSRPWPLVAPDAPL